MGASLRRAFGNRGTRRIPDHDLQLLMRHSDIKTTLNFKVGQRSDDARAVIWNALNADRNQIYIQSADRGENQPTPNQQKTPQPTTGHGVR